MSGLYVLGILVGILIAFLYRGTLFKGEPVPFVMELPNYRLPGAKNVAQLLWEKGERFPAEGIFSNSDRNDCGMVPCRALICI